VVDTQTLSSWLRHNVGDLRMEPDMVTEATTEASGPTLRFRWHNLVSLDGLHYGIGIDLLPGPSLGEIWIYGHEVKNLRLYPHRTPIVPHSVRARLRCILVAHVSDHEHGWGRSAHLFGPSPLAEASA